MTFFIISHFIKAENQSLTAFIQESNDQKLKEIGWALDGLNDYSKKTYKLREKYDELDCIIVENEILRKNRNPNSWDKAISELAGLDQILSSRQSFFEPDYIYLNRIFKKYNSKFIYSPDVSRTLLIREFVPLDDDSLLIQIKPFKHYKLHEKYSIYINDELVEKIPLKWSDKMKSIETEEQNSITRECKKRSWNLKN